MVTLEKFYGGAAIRDVSTIHGIPQRVLDVTGLAELRLPSREGLCPGGPYFILINNGPATLPLKDELGATLLTLADDSITTVCLGTSRWLAASTTKGASRDYGTDTDARNGIEFGLEITPETPEEPTSYDSILCDGGYRRARFCSTGARAKIWMLDSEVTPHFVGGVAVFIYLGNNYYFKETDRLVTGHGFTLETGDVTWTGGDCADALAGNYCSQTNPNWPHYIWINIVDPQHALDNEDSFNGTWKVHRNAGGNEYRLRAKYLPHTWMYLTAQCRSEGWVIKFGYDLTSSPGGSGIVAWNEFTNVAKPLSGPAVGTYEASDGDGGFATGTCMGVGCWTEATVKVTGYGV